MDRITIVGMGPLGASIGLGLKRAGLTSTEIVGTDRDRHALSQASRMGAVDKAVGSLRSALDGAQLVVLDTPLTDTRETLEAIGPLLEKGCVVTDTGTVKALVIEWAQDTLPHGISFVGGHPILRRTVVKLNDAEAGLLDGAEYCVIPAESADPESVKTVVGMVEALGARPLFLDAKEHDSYAAAIAQLPLVLSSALVNSTASSVSWREISRLAGAGFREVSQLAAGDPAESAAACLADPEALAHWLDQAIAVLSSYRDQLKEGDDTLLDRFVHAWEERTKWETDAVVGEAGEDIPSAAHTMAGMVLSRRLVERYRQITGAKKRPR